MDLPERTAEAASAPASSEPTERKRARRSFRPNLKASIAGIISILLILAFNITMVSIIFSRQLKQASSLNSIVTTPDQLGKVGENQGVAGQNVNLVVTPNAQFKGQVVVDKAVQVGDKLTAPAASLTQLQAGNSSITQLNVSGASTLTDASLRGSLNVAGNANLQGTVTIGKLLTAPTLNVTGNLTVGGSFTTNNFSARSLTSISSLTIGGHVITAGSRPGISGGNCLGGGSVSISGNDVAGTIVISPGQTPCNGVLANVSFISPYGSIPHVVITPVGSSGGLNYYINRSASGFSIGSDGNSVQSGPASYAFDYIVMQ